MERDHNYFKWSNVLRSKFSTYLCEPEVPSGKPHSISRSKGGGIPATPISMELLSSQDGLYMWMGLFPHLLAPPHPVFYRGLSGGV